MNLKRGVLIATLAMSGWASAGEPRLEPMRPQSAGSSGGWRISAGYIHRQLGDVRFQTGSYSQDVLLRSMVGSPFRRNSGAGAPNAPDLRFYDDGFVRPDSSGSVDGLTWFWGYDSASQVGGDSIVFRDSSARQRKVWSSSSYQSNTWGDQIEEGGPLLNLEYQFPLAHSLKAGLGVGVSMIEWGGSNQTSTFRAGQLGIERQTIVTDAFGLGGAIPPLAPYEGSLIGPGILLDAIPSDRAVATRETDRVRYDFFNRVNEELELDLYTLSPGFNLEWQKGRVFASAGAGVAINIVDWEASYDETLYVSKNGGKARAARTWSERSGGTDVLWGAYIQAAVGVELTERLSVQGFARYDWSESFEASVGPSDFSVDLEGVSGGVMASWKF